MQVLEGITGSKLAGAAVFLEIAAELNIVDILRGSGTFTQHDIENDGLNSPEAMSKYIEALASAGLIVCVGNDPVTYRKSDDFEEIVNHVGYVSWALRSCSPLIENAPAFLADTVGAQRKYPRNGKSVARTSQWMGFQSFYPVPEDTIVELNPRKVVDLGSGSGSLLVKLMKRLPEASGLGVDISESAVEYALEFVRQHGMSDRISFVQAPIQDLSFRPELLEEADLIHGGFVFHDLLPQDDDALDSFFEFVATKPLKCSLVFVDAVPHSEINSEKIFTAAFNYLHEQFMSRKLLSEAQWTKKLKNAGFSRIYSRKLDHPGGRMFIAKP
ncbi:methyltransferase domain-containing protein [Pseudomonas sp. D1-3]